MWRQLCTVMFLALLAQGCANRPGPKSVSSASFFRVDYQGWSCQQLAEEADLLKDALEVANEHPSDAHSTETVPHLRRAMESVRTASNLKGCRAHQ